MLTSLGLTILIEKRLGDQINNILKKINYLLQVQYQLKIVVKNYL
jgi:hypothetical protein